MIRNHKIICIFILVTILSSALILPKVIFAAEKQGNYPTSWTHKKIEETLSRGTTKELKISFVSRIDLKKVNLWMTPELRPFIKIIPNAFERIEANTPYEVTLQFTIPSDAKLGHYDGTIHLRVGSKTYPQTLKIKLDIVSVVNAPPVANAGPDQVIALPEGQTTIDVQLYGSGSYDPDGTIVSYNWTGTPDPEDIVNPTVQLKQGIYDFTLTVSDDKGASSSDTTKVTVLGPPFLMPIPEVTGVPTIKIRGISIPGATILITNDTTAESKEVLNERGFFEVPINLAQGVNEIRATVRLGDIESVPSTLKTVYTPHRLLQIDAITPNQGQAGSIITITGSGFTPDPNVMGVHFVGPEMEGTGLRMEGKGVVLEATETSLRVVVPFIFLKDFGSLEVYVYDNTHMSNSLPFQITPASDPTPDIKGNEAIYQLDLILTQLQHIYNKLEQWTKPNVPPETWAQIEENIRRTQYFLESIRDRINSIPSDEIRANLDALFGSDFFSHVAQRLEEINEKLSHTTPCDIAEVIQILNEILGPINTLNDVLDGVKDTLIAIQLGNGIACIFGCVPCCTVIPLLSEVYSTVCAIDSIVDGVLKVFNTVINMMSATIPTIPSEWKIVVSGPFPGIHPSYLYTYTSNKVKVYANFTNAGFEQLLRNIGQLRIDIPDPFGIFSLLRLFGIDLEEVIENTLGRLLLDLAVDLLNIDEIRVTFADINIPSTVRHAPNSRTELVNVLAPEHLGNEHIIVAGSSPGDGVFLDIQASCEVFHYPDRTHCIRKSLDGRTCLEWQQEYAQYHHIKVIDSPTIVEAGWVYKGYDTYYLNIIGEGYTTTGNSYGMWEGSPLYPYLDEYYFLSFLPLEYYHGFNGSKPGWFSVVTQGVDEETGQILRRESNSVFIPASADLQADMHIKNPLLYPGDTLYISGNYFSRTETRLALNYGGQSFGPIQPSDVYYGPFTYLDLFGFSVPMFHSEGFSYSGVTLQSEVRVEDGRPCQWNNCQHEEIKILPHESTGYTSADDQDFMIFGPQRGSYLRSAALGDLNGDGINDLVIGVPNYKNNEGRSIGAIYIIFGPIEGNRQLYGNRLIETIDLAPWRSHWDTIIMGDERDVLWDNSRRIGYSIAVGDVNGDGIDDLLIGTRDQNEREIHCPELWPTCRQEHISGKAYLFYGRRNWQGFYYVWDSNVKFYGDDQRELGYQVGIGKVFGNARIKDIVITAPTDSIDPNTPNQNVARTYVIKGWDTQSSYPENLHFTIKLPDDLIDNPGFLVIEGKNYYQTKFINFATGEYVQYKGDGMGKSLSIGDINGDGYDDIVLGAPQYSRIISLSPSSAEEGAIYIIYGSPSLQGYKYVYPTDGDQNTSIVGPRLWSREERDDLGKSVHIVDLNGDGKGEIVVGAPSAKLNLDIYPHLLINPDLQSIAEIREPGIGRIYIVDGLNANLERKYNNVNIADMIINGSRSISKFGYSLSSGDINNDGINDLIVGAPGKSHRDTAYMYQRGNVWVLYGNRNSKWRETLGQDVVHLENRRWYRDVEDFDYSNDAGLPLDEGFDYLIIGPYESCEVSPCTRFGTFITAGDLNPYIGDDIVIISPKMSAPVPLWPDDFRAGSGMLYVFYEGSTDLWPLTIHPETVNMYFCDSEQRFTVSGGLPPYRFNWYSCWQTTNPWGGPGPVICGEDLPLPDNFDVEYRENSVFLRINGCIPNDLTELSLKVTDWARTSVTKAINFLKPDIAVSHSSVDFGNVQVGWTVNIPVTVTNTGNGNLMINNISLTVSSDIRIRNNCPPLLQPQSSCTIDAIFAPTSEGPAAATLSITSNDPDEGVVNIPMTGNGIINLVPDMVVIGGNLVFWNVPIGSSSSQDIIIENRGRVDLVINNVYLTGASEFKISANTCIGAPIPPPNPPYPAGTCRITVTFTPTGTSPVYGNIYIDSNDPDTPRFIGHLSGNGVPPALYLDPTSLDFGLASTQTAFRIINSEWNCVDNLQWQITGDLPSWLSVSPMNGSITSCGGFQTVTVQVNRDGLPAGEYTHTVSIISNSGSGIVQVKMNVAIPITPVLISVTPSSLDFAEAKKRLPIMIQNTSSTASVTWGITNDLPSWLTASQMGGMIPPGGSTTIYLYANRTGLYIGQTYTHTLSITSNVGNLLGSDVKIPVSMTVPTPLATFAKYYGGEGGEYFSKIRPTSDGGFIAVGLTNSFGAGAEDAWVVKLDSSGYIEWEKTFGGRYAERAYDVRETLDRGYIVVAGTYSFTSDEEYSLWILKLNSYGDIEWQRQYGGYVDDNWGDWGIELSIQQTLDGGYILGGNTWNTPITQRQDIWVLKLDSNGNIQWQKTYGGSQDDYANSIQLTSDGGYIIAGVTRSFNSDRKPDMWVLKLDPNGNIQWEKAYGGAGWDVAYEIQQTNDGGYILIGYSDSFGNATILKLDSSGNIQWQKSYGGWDGYGHSIKQTEDGGYIFTGYFWRRYIGGDIWVVKLDPSGNIEWQRTYGGDRFEVAYHIEQTPDGDYILAGYTNSFRVKPPYNYPNYDAFVMKIDSIGNIGSSCGLLDLTSIIPADIYIVPVYTSATTGESNTTPQATNASIIDSLAETDAICSETEEQARQRPIIEIEVFPMNYDFGEVIINNTSSQIFTVRNLGYTPLTINNITLSGSLDYSGEHNCPNILGIARKCEITISFTPSAEGLQEAYLQIESNDPDEGLIEIPISGTGVIWEECPPEECPNEMEPLDKSIIIE